MPSDSMNIGITGLDAYQAQIDVISNNIANVGTVAYKGQNLSFQDLLYQTQQPGSGPTKTSGGVNYQQIGIGVKIGGTDTNTTQGGVQSTGVTTNMMINGDGYFMLKNADGTGTPKYTRNGDFSLNSTGLLFDPTSGQAVMGYGADSAGNIISGAPGPITVPIGLKAVATATGTGVKAGPTGDKVFSMSWGGNLDSNQYAKAVAAAATATAAPGVAASAAAAALTTSVTTAATALTNVTASDTAAGSAAVYLAANNAAATAAAAGGATAATVKNAANPAANAVATNLATDATNANTAAGAGGATVASVVASVTSAAGLAVANNAAGLTGATPASVALAVQNASNGATAGASAENTVANNAVAVAGSNATTVAAALSAANTTSATAATTALAASTAATANAANAQAASNAAAATSAALAASTNPASIAAAFAAASTPAAAGTTIYDSLGGAHLMSVSFAPANLGASMPLKVNDASGTAKEAATAWTYTLSSSDGTQFANGSTTSAPQYAFFDQDGQFINTSGTAVPLATTVHAAGSPPAAGSGNQLAVTQWGTPAGANNSSAVVAPPPAGPIGIDFSGMVSQATSAQVTATYQDGYPPGTLDNMTVGQDGTVTGAYTNGQSVAIARVALATFQNEAGLIRAGGSDYLESVDSGIAQVGSAQTGRFGSITGNALELSNVSIGDEFTKLITAQNAFTANSKSITTANADDQTVINLIR